MNSCISTDAIALSDGISQLFTKKHPAVWRDAFLQYLKTYYLKTKTYRLYSSITRNTSATPQA